MTELRVKLRRRELDYLRRTRDGFFGTTDGTYIGQLVRYRFLEALAQLDAEAQPPKSHQRKTPTSPDDSPVTEPDPYADEPEEDA